MKSKRILDIYSNAKINIKLGLISKIARLLTNFIVQTMLIKKLGMEYVGVQGVFTSLLSVLNLAELGVGSAIIYSLYKPIAEEDDESICAILNYYRKIYRKVGSAIVLLALAISPFLGLFFKDGVSPEINIYIVFVLFIINTVMPYWLFSYKLCILNAFQKTDAISVVEILTCMVTLVFQIISLVVFKNYYLSLVLVVICTVIYNVCISYYVNKKYPMYKCYGHISDELHHDIIKKVSGVFISKVCMLSRNAFDCVFVSIFIGVTTAGIYSNYYYVMDAVVVIFSVVAPSIIGGIGNNIQTKGVEQNLHDMLMINYIYMVFSGWAAICLLCLYQPFVTIWMGEKNLFPFGVVLLFVIYFYLRQMGNVRAIYSDAAGLFWENRRRSLLEAVCNVILNYVFVLRFGIYGIVFATVLTLFVFGFIASALVLFKNYFKTGAAEYFLNNLKYSLVTTVVALITYNVCLLFHGETYLVLIYRALVCLIIPPVIYYVFYRESKSMKVFLVWWKSIRA